MKRTHKRMKHDEYGNWHTFQEITCSVVGEMADGTKVWRESKFNGQPDAWLQPDYYLVKVDGAFYFVQM